MLLHQSKDQVTRHARDGWDSLVQVHPDRRGQIQTAQIDRGPLLEHSKTNLTAGLSMVAHPALAPSDLHQTSCQRDPSRKPRDQRKLHEMSSNVLLSDDQLNAETTTSAMIDIAKATIVPLEATKGDANGASQHSVILPNRAKSATIPDSQTSNYIMISSDSDDDINITIPKPYVKHSSGPFWRSNNLACLSNLAQQPDTFTNNPIPISSFTAINHHAHPEITPKKFKLTFSPPQRAESKGLRASLSLKRKPTLDVEDLEVAPRPIKICKENPPALTKTAPTTQPKEKATDPTYSLHKHQDLFTHTLSRHIMNEYLPSNKDHSVYHTSCTGCYTMNLDAKHWNPARHGRTLSRFPEIAAKEKDHRRRHRVALAGLLDVSSDDDNGVTGTEAKRNRNGVEGLNWFVTESESDEEYRRVDIRKQRREERLKREIAQWDEDHGVGRSGKEKALRGGNLEYAQIEMMEGASSNRADRDLVVPPSDESEGSDYWEYNEE